MHWVTLWIFILCFCIMIVPSVRPTHVLFLPSQGLVCFTNAYNRSQVHIILHNSQQPPLWGSNLPSAGFLPDDVQTIREFIAAQTQSGAPRPDPGLDPSAFRMWTRLSGDPDTDLAQWLDTGAPLGIIHPVTSKGIFPPVDSIVPTSESIAPPFP